MAMGGISAEQKLALLEYWRSVVKRRWAILALGLLVAVVAGIASFALTPVYSTSATVLIEAGRGKIVGIEEVYSISQEREHYQTQVEIVRSRDVAERTARALKLWNRPEFDPRQPKLDWRGQALALLGAGGRFAKTEWTDEALLKSATEQVRESVSVAPVRGSQLVRVYAESTNPLLAAELANTLAQQYIEGERDERYLLTQQVSQQLQDRLADLRTKLSGSERTLQDYREKRGIVALAGSAQGVTGQTLGETIKTLGEAQARRAMLEGEYQQAQQAGADYSTIPSVARSPLVSEAQRGVTVGQANLADLQSNLGPAHFRVQNAQAELSELRSTLRRHQLAAVAVLTREYQAARNTEQTLTTFLDSARGAAQNVNRQEFELTVLERDYQSNKQLYEVFMSRAKETNLMGDLQPKVARVVDRAIPAGVPYKPNKQQVVVVALMLALLLGALASIVLDRMDNTVKGPDDAEARLHLPVLAALPMVMNQDHRHMARHVIEQPNSHFAEGIRTVRTGVMLSNLDLPHKSLLVTSTLPGEGKTTLSINLALAHAQTSRTLLIDADMRRGQAGRALGLPLHTKGLTNLVAGTAKLRDCIYPVRDSNLHMLPVGDLPPNPLDLLLSQRFKDVFTELCERYEMVIIDCLPVEFFSEALVLAPMCTSTTLVVKAMSTPAPLVRKSLTRLQRGGARLLGVMVNQLDFSRAQKYHGESGSGWYNYGDYGYAPRAGIKGAAVSEGGGAALAAGVTEVEAASAKGTDTGTDTDTGTAKG